MHRNSTTVSTKQKRIAALANQSPHMAFTSLAYLMDVDWLKEAYRRTRKNGAVGVDGVTAVEYEQDLEGNLQRLLDRAKSGTYWFGDFTVPPHTSIEQRGVLRLIIHDGREGDILLDTKCVDSDDHSVIRFHGCSPLG